MEARARGGRIGADWRGALIAIVRPLVIVVAAALVLWVADIGCVFRFVFGVPCPGCGMTRAWLAALRLDAAAALAYHPLFWVFPFAIVLAAVQPRMQGAPRRALTVAAAALAAALVILWAVRLASPADAGLLFSGVAPAGVPTDIIHLEPNLIARLMRLGG